VAKRKIHAPARDLILIVEFITIRSSGCPVPAHVYGHVHTYTTCYINLQVQYTMVQNMYVGRSGKLLLVLVSTVILGSGSRETHDHNFVSRLWESCNYSRCVCEKHLGFTSVKLGFENVPSEAEYRKRQGWVQIRVSARVTLRPTASRSVRLGAQPHVGLTTRY
jgi:hypothetical protein